WRPRRDARPAAAAAVRPRRSAACRTQRDGSRDPGSAVHSSGAPSDASRLEPAGVQDLVLEALGLLVAEGEEGGGVISCGVEIRVREVVPFRVSQCAAHCGQLGVDLLGRALQPLQRTSRLAYCRITHHYLLHETAGRWPDPRGVAMRGWALPSAVR